MYQEKSYVNLYNFFLKMTSFTNPIMFIYVIDAHFVAKQTGEFIKLLER